MGRHKAAMIRSRQTVDMIRLRLIFLNSNYKDVIENAGDTKLRDDLIRNYIEAFDRWDERLKRKCKKSNVNYEDYEVKRIV